MKQAELKRQPDSGATREDAEMEETVAQEEKVLGRVHRTVAARRPTHRGQLIDYDAELIALRDQIREARLEDIPDRKSTRLNSSHANESRMPSSA